MLEKLNFIQEITSFYSGAQVHWMPGAEDTVRNYLVEHIAPKLGVNLGNYTSASMLCALDNDHIYEFTPFPGVSVLIYHSVSPAGILLLGPVTTESYSTHALLSYLQRQNISQPAADQFLKKMDKLPKAVSHNLYRLMDILLRHLCNLAIPVPVKRLESTSFQDPMISLTEVQQLQDISHIRLIENRYKISGMLTEAVKLGNLSLALQTLRDQGAAYETIVRNKNPLRNMQNQCIILNTQLRHTLEGGNIHPYQVDQLSHEIGLQIERLNSPEMAVPFSNYIVEQYCRLVQEHSYQNLSDLIHQAVVYIKNNLHANLTVRDTAQALSIHPDYLSHQFSKEMGMTFIAFLNQERCKQAASYLVHTALQVKQISAIVGFNTISYFTKQFTQFYGKTPRDFRNERLLTTRNKTQ